MNYIIIYFYTLLNDISNIPKFGQFSNPIISFILLSATCNNNNEGR